MLKITGVVGAVVVAVSLLAAPTSSASDGAMVVSVDGVDVEIPALPDRLSAAEMNEIGSSGSFDIALPPEELNEVLPNSGVSLDISENVNAKLSEESVDITSGGVGGSGFSIRSAGLVAQPAVVTSRAGDKCDLDPGRMWESGIRVRLPLRLDRFETQTALLYAGGA